MQHVAFAVAMVAALFGWAIPFAIVNSLEFKRGRFWVITGMCAFIQAPLCWLIWEQLIPAIVSHPPGHVGELVFVVFFPVATLVLAAFAWFMEYGFY